MASVALRAASVGSRNGAGDIEIVGIAPASAKISQVAHQEAEKLKDKAQNEDNESSIRRLFLDNAISSVRTATFDQYNIVICSDQENDEFHDLQGQILPMDMVDVEVTKDAFVKFKVYVFDTGRYIRHGKMDGDHWRWWDESKIQTDPVPMQVHFENAQPKKNACEINTFMGKQAADRKAAAGGGGVAAKTAKDASAADEAAPKAEAELKSEEAPQTENDEPSEEQLDDDVDEVSDDVEEASGDEEEASEDEEARSEDLEEK
ncbi:hypothetical protein DHEL01_v206668 [Diaporthe helianthi]|uniref:Uncharacterized protein n=1 Tax=Diaporthe helianthi TaxID=158607 RepID=A0A2P5HXF2_DIAHE|nr:hypothetical protein DHEL01_v206668 [Diaporthe helianthi]